MSEEIRDEVIEEPQDQEVIEQAIEPVEVEDDNSPVDEEEIARSKGWVPEEEYEGKSHPVSAAEFLRRESLLARISEGTRKTKTLESTVKQLIEHNKKLAVAAKEKQIRELEQEKLDAVQYGDTARYHEANDAQLKVMSDPVPEIAAHDEEFEPEDKDAFVEFKKKHEKVWLNQNTKENQLMYQSADWAYEWARMNHPEWSVKECLNYTEEDIKTKYNHRFRSKRDATVNSVESGANRVNKTPSGKLRFNDLDDYQKKFCKECVDGGVMTEAEYLSQIEMIRKQRGL